MVKVLETGENVDSKMTKAVASPTIGHRSDVGVATSEGGTPEAAFSAALDGLAATGASVDMRELVELIVQHGAEEGALLATYGTLATESPDESVRYLINLILEDEHRHHRLLAELGNAMAWGVASEAPSPAVPRLPRAIDGALLEQTKLLRNSEEADYRALQGLRRRLRPFADTTLWVLVVDLMLLDTKKHATILRFLERRRNNR